MRNRRFEQTKVRIGVHPLLNRLPKGPNPCLILSVLTQKVNAAQLRFAKLATKCEMLNGKNTRLSGCSFWMKQSDSAGQRESQTQTPRENGSDSKAVNQKVRFAEAPENLSAGRP